MPAIAGGLLLLGGSWLTLRELTNVTDAMTRFALVASAGAGIYLAGKKLKVF